MAGAGVGMRAAGPGPAATAGRRPPPSAAASPQRFCFTDLEQQAQRVLAQARAQAAEVLRAAEQQAAALAAARQEAGYAAGLAAGRAAGLAQVRAEARAAAEQAARDEIAALTGALRTALAEFEQGKRGLLAAAESGLIELALAIAQRVCKAAAGADSAPARGNARALLEMAQHAGDAALHLNPEDCTRLATQAPEFVAAVKDLGHVRLVPDEQVAAGGCVLRSADGEIDAGIQTQLDRIAEALRAT